MSEQPDPTSEFDSTTRTAGASSSMRNGDADGDGSPWASVANHLAELKEFAANYVSARADSAKLSIQRLVFVAVFVIVASLAAAALCVTAAALLVIGLANLIAAGSTPPRPWFGQIVMGTAVLAGVLVGVVVFSRRLFYASRQKMVLKYESRHAAQRDKFGEDAAEASVRG